MMGTLHRHHRAVIRTSEGVWRFMRRRALILDRPRSAVRSACRSLGPTRFAEASDRVTGRTAKSEPRNFPLQPSQTRVAAGLGTKKQLISGLVLANVVVHPLSFAAR